MSIKSTHYVTREFAIEAIIHKSEELQEYTDDQISDILESIIHNGFYNFSIVTEEQIEKERNSIYGGRYFDSVYELPSPNDAY